DKAVSEGDLDTAASVVQEYASLKGYGNDSDYRMSHRAPSNNGDDVSLSKLMDSDIVPSDYWTHPRYYVDSRSEMASHSKIKRMAEKAKATGKPVMLSMYRSVPKNVKEDSFRNGDWITPSREYAALEGSSIPGGY